MCFRETVIFRLVGVLSVRVFYLLKVKAAFFKVLLKALGLPVCFLAFFFCLFFFLLVCRRMP